MFQSFFDELTKLAEKEVSQKKEDLGTRTMRSFVRARPYAAGFMKGGLPSALVAKTLFPGGESAAAKHLGRYVPLAALGIGGALGVTNEAIQRWAAKNPKTGISKEIEKGGGVANTFLKVTAMATDLRTTGIGGVKRPPMPTEDSKQKAFQAFENSTKPGKFLSSTQPRHLRAPGPSIKQVSALPTG